MTTEAERIHAAGEPGRGYCGRKATGPKVTRDWADTNCGDCHAAHRADTNETRTR